MTEFAAIEQVREVLSWEAIDPDPASWGGERADARDNLAALQALAEAAEDILAHLDEPTVFRAWLRLRPDESDPEDETVTFAPTTLHVQTGETKNLRDALRVRLDAVRAGAREEGAADG